MQETNTPAYESEQQYLELLYTLEYSLRDFLSSMCRFGPLINEEERQRAASILATLIPLVDSVKASGLKLAAQFPDCVLVREKPKGVFVAHCCATFNNMGDRLAEAVADLNFPQKDAITIRSLIIGRELVCGHLTS
jgi:hypothetical protein